MIYQQMNNKTYIFLRAHTREIRVEQNISEA